MTPPDAPLALTMGDPAGVGGEITVAAWRALAPGAATGGPRFCAFDDPERLAAFGASVTRVDDASDATPELFARRLPVVETPSPGPVVLGRPAPSTAPAVIASIETAVAAAMSNSCAGVVTNPINKAVLKEGAAFAHPGHTEFIAALTGAPRPVMLLAGDILRVAPLTIHLPLRDAPAAVTPELLTETLRVLDAGLRSDFGVAAPRIAVAGLNPHAGENGVLGREEIEIIAPTLARLRNEGLTLSGPLSADTMFHADARRRYDVALTMYHDQGLIPIKTLEFDRGVNATLGLPIVRTSPDHGVAYDIVGSGRARPDSLIAAVERAWEMARMRRAGAVRSASIG